MKVCAEALCELLHEPLLVVGEGGGHLDLHGHDLVTAAKRPMYVCAADNRASEALAKSAGFELRMRLGCLEGR